MGAPPRPDPDHILKVLDLESRLRQRGRLKIFFGGSAGVGKTYAMLQAAQQERADGRDILIGVVETHGRQETMRMTEGLTALPRKKFTRGSVTVEEFDLDNALIRRPQLIVVDELAHSNAAGSRHPKRWQDVEELLDAGIDVYTSLNVQHLEGFNDVIAGITGVVVQEIVPDVLFDEANEIQLVDVPTEELLERLKTGKVYIAPEAAERAAQNFFSKTNLMSLRELALRRTAEHVDADTDYQRVQDGLFTPNIAGDRVLVCIGQDELGMKLVRTARKIATSLKAPWYALAIERASGNKDDADYQRQQRALNSAEKNGASKIATVQEERVGDAIIHYAVNNGITKIIVGRHIRPAWQDWLQGSLVEHLIRHSGDIDVYVITGHGGRRRLQRRTDISTMKDYGGAVAMLIACTTVGFLLRQIVQPIDVIMIYLVGVILCAVRFGRLPSFVFALLSVGTLNFFFIEPIFTFTIVDRSYWFSLIVMLITSFVISEQATRLKRQTELSRQRENHTQIFYELTKELSAKRDQASIIESSVTRLAEGLGMPSNFWQPAEQNTLQPTGSAILEDRLKEETVAIWAFQNGQPAGIGTNTMPSAKGYYYPLQSGFGVLSVQTAGGGELSIDQKTIIETFARLLSTSLERVSAARSAEQLKLDTETERLKNTFLSSMSHDLRTPLASIRGSAETLLKTWDDITDEVRRRLLTSVRDETERLSRVVRNLLDLTRFETGRISIRQQPYYLQEIVGSVLKQMQDTLAEFRISTDIPKGLPMVNADALLIGQVLQNLLENAASFSRHGQVIEIIAYSNNQMVTVEIRDNGPGIAAGKEREIFNKFFTMAQADRPKGAGLGLAICQAIIVAHGGAIEAKNRDYGGACVTFTLPAFEAAIDQPA